MTVYSTGECAFNSGADYIYESHQGFELEVEAQENEENDINETFPKVDRWRKVRIMVPFSLPMNRLA